MNEAHRAEGDVQVGDLHDQQGAPSEGPAGAPTGAAVREALRSVVDPELGSNLVDLGMIGSIEISPAGAVTVEVGLTVASCPLRGPLQRDVERRVADLDGVSSVDVRIGVLGPEQRREVMARARRRATEQPPPTQIPPTARILAVASGKGGVGKSSLTVNLACSLAVRGLKVGVLDADIAGYSIPRMLGLDGRLEPEGTKDDWSLVPLEQPVGDGLLRVVSMGLLGAREGEAIMWRGLLLARALQHFIEDVSWGDIDYLLVDMPPGTGDVQMGLARLVPGAEVLIVTTPPLAASNVAARMADMARKHYLHLAGVIENMSSFTCAHGEVYELFGSGGGASLAEQLGVPLIGSVPFDPAVGAGSDRGRPAVLEGEGPVTSALRELAEQIATVVAPPVSMAACTVRMLERVEALVAAGTRGDRRAS